MRYSVEHRDWIFVKDYRFFSFHKTIGTNIGQNVRKNVTGKYSQKHFDHAKQSAKDALKTTSKKKKKQLKKAEATCDSIANKYKQNFKGYVMKRYRDCFTNTWKINRSIGSKIHITTKTKTIHWLRLK